MNPVFPSDLMAQALHYLRLLEKWNQTHALTALAPEIQFEELILDSAALLPHLDAFPPGSRLVDFGSGMGIPATPIALARPDLEVIAMDASAKKVAFIRQVALELGIKNLKPVHGRAEKWSPCHAQAGCSKATGHLALLTSWWTRHGDPQGVFFAFKGPEWQQEPVPIGWELTPVSYQLPTRGTRYLLRMRII